MKDIVIASAANIPCLVNVPFGLIGSIRIC